MSDPRQAALDALDKQIEHYKDAPEQWSLWRRHHAALCLLRVWVQSSQEWPPPILADAPELLK